MHWLWSCAHHRYLGLQTGKATCRFSVAIPLAYLSITGSRLIGTVTSEEDARSTLLRLADERRLTAKVSRFLIDWRGDHFHIAIRTVAGTPG